MNRFFMLAMTVLLVSTGRAQNVVNPFPKTITVSGSAEMEIVPDEIYVMVDLKEYEKKGQGKVAIDKIRQDFLSAVRSLGLPDSAVSVAAYDGYNGNPWLRKKNKKDELYASITYQVKLRSAAQVDQLVDRLDDNATSNFYIASTSHSKLAEFRKHLKIQAVKAAKEKAGYLAEAINEQVGVAVTINEPNEYFQPFYGLAANRMMKAQALDAVQTADQPQADFKKMKLKYDVTVVFALK
ncbi:MAG: SIMPL domain-containing protein [Flavisolibacter sp.]